MTSDQRYVLFGFLIPNKEVKALNQRLSQDDDNYLEKELMLNALRVGNLREYIYSLNDKLHLLETISPLPENFDAAFNNCDDDCDLIIYTKADLAAALRGDISLPDMRLALEWADNNSVIFESRIAEIHELPYWCASDFYG